MKHLRFGLFFFALICGIAEGQTIPPVSGPPPVKNPPVEWKSSPQGEITQVVSELASEDEKPFIVVVGRVERTMEPKSVTDVMIDCVKNKTCKEAVDTLAAYFGYNTTYVTTGAAVLTSNAVGEDADFSFGLPSGYKYCRSRITVISVAPFNGDRASFFTASATPRGIDAHTWTPRQGLGKGRSWVEAEIDIIGIRDEEAGNPQWNAGCATKKLTYSCRGNGQNRHGHQACGIADDSPGRPLILSR